MKIKFMGCLGEHILFFKVEEFVYIFVCIYDGEVEEIFVRDNWVSLVTVSPDITVTSIGGHDPREDIALEALKKSNVLQQIKRLKDNFDEDRRKICEEFEEDQNEIIKSFGITIE